MRCGGGRDSRRLLCAGSRAQRPAAYEPANHWPANKVGCIIDGFGATKAAKMWRIISAIRGEIFLVDAINVPLIYALCACIAANVMCAKAAIMSLVAALGAY